MKTMTKATTWVTMSAAFLALTGSALPAAPAEGPIPLDPPGCWDADGIWHPDCWGPGQWGRGPYGPGQWGPGMMGPGPWGPGMMGPGQWGPGMGPGMMGPGPWGY